MTDTEQLPPPGPSGYQPRQGEGIDYFAVTVKRDGIEIDLSYVFDEPRPTALALQPIEELYAAVAAMTVPKSTGDVPPVAAPRPVTPDPAADVRPPTQAPALVLPPASVQPAGHFPSRPTDVMPAIPTLEQMRAGAEGDKPTPQQPAGPTRQQQIDTINAENMGPNGPF